MSEIKIIFKEKEICKQYRAILNFTVTKESKIQYIDCDNINQTLTLSPVQTMAIGNKETNSLKIFCAKSILSYNDREITITEIGNCGDDIPIEENPNILDFIIEQP